MNEILLELTLVDQNNKKGYALEISPLSNHEARIKLFNKAQGSRGRNIATIPVIRDKDLAAYEISKLSGYKETGVTTHKDKEALKMAVDFSIIERELIIDYSKNIDSYTPEQMAEKENEIKEKFKNFQDKIGGINSSPNITKADKLAQEARNKRLKKI